MGIFDKLFGKKPETIVEAPKPVKEKKPRKPKEKKEQPTTSDKEKATSEGLPYVNIVKMELDPYDINSGAFELDWNDKFVLNLIRAGYKIKEEDSDVIIVERWFQQVARNIAMEVYEQQAADPDNRDMRVVRSRDLGDGRTEIS